MPIEIEVDGHGVLEFPDGTSDDVISATVRSVTGAKGDAQSAPERTWTDTAVDALPMVGGSLGGLVGLAGGPVGAAAGAALGGAGGEGWRRTIQGLRGKRNSAADSVGDTLGGLAKEGAIQAGAEVTGGLAGKGLQKGATALYRGLLKPSVAVRKGFGGDDVARTLIDAGATISQSGLSKATGKLGASRSAAMRMVQDAAPGSTFIKPHEITSEFGDVVKTLRRRADVGQPNELGRVGERGRRLVTSLKRGVDAGGGQALKETAQDAASGAYRAMERGGAKQLSADDLLDEATARGFKKAVETRVPGVKAQNQTTQRLLGGTRALEDAVERGANTNAVGGMRDGIAAGVGASLAGPAGASAGLLMRLLTSPRVGSAAAIGMDRTGKHVPIDDLVRALQFAMQEPQ